MGPTACGKSKLAINLRRYLPIELISVDSALIYRGMNIGTSKPSVLDLLNHPHRLINIKDPIEKYSVAEFQQDVLKEISDIIMSGKIPCLVGGTMFYYNILLSGLCILPESDMKIRQYLIKKMKNKDYLHKKLKIIDPSSALRIHKNDVQRLLRALEVFYISGKTVTQLTQNKKYKFPYNILQFAIFPPSKEWLYKKIEYRLHDMFNVGFQREVEKLFFRGDLNTTFQSIKSIGYRQMWEYFEYKISYKDMFNNIIYSTRHLAKHQLTWLKRWKNIHILYAQEKKLLVFQFLNILKKINYKD